MFVTVGGDRVDVLGAGSGPWGRKARPGTQPHCAAGIGYLTRQFDAGPPWAGEAVKEVNTRLLTTSPSVFLQMRVF